MILSMYEILDLFKRVPTRKEKIEVLRKNNGYMLETVLRMVFDPNIIFFTTDFPPNYRPDKDAPIGMGHSHLSMELRKFYLFRKEYNLPTEKKMELLTQMLESLEPREAEIVIAIFKKQLPAQELTLHLVREAFPRF